MDSLSGHLIALAKVVCPALGFFSVGTYFPQLGHLARWSLLAPPPVPRTPHLIYLLSHSVNVRCWQVLQVVSSGPRPNSFRQGLPFLVPRNQVSRFGSLRGVSSDCSSPNRLIMTCFVKVDLNYTLRAVCINPKNLGSYLATFTG